MAAEMKNTTEAVEAEYVRARTSVWWDIENCPVPKACDAHMIAQILSSALMKMNYCGPLSISSYGNTNLIPNSVQQALSSTGIALNHVPSGRKDASDKKILVDMFLWVMENPAPANIMIISGDGDFSNALHRLRMKRYNILLGYPQQASASLVASAKTTWTWTSLLAGVSPLTECESSRLLHNVHSPSNSEITIQAVSEQALFRQPMDSGSGSSRRAGNKLKRMYVPKASKQLLLQKTTRKNLQKNYTKTGGSSWFCKVCNVACKSFEIFTTHLSGKEHAAQWELKQNLGEFDKMSAAPSECHENGVEMKDKVAEAVDEAISHCGSCSVVCPGQTSLDSQPKNAAMVMKQAEALLNAKNSEEIVQENEHESMTCLEKQNKDLTETCKESERSGLDFWQDYKERIESERGAPLNADCVFSELSRDLRVPKEVRECFDTILKKLEPLQNEIVLEKVEALDGMPKQSLEMKSSEPENAHAGPSEHLEEDMNKKKKLKMKKKEKKKNGTLIEDGTEAYVCSLCSVTCDCPTVFESHLKGRKHAAMIKKHTEALLDDKQIQEKIIQDNGHPKELTDELKFQPGNAPENIDFLEIQNKELRDRCATSERSVEELCQTVEEVLENENKSLPNAECIFTGLNPKFSAPKEARDWFDAIIKKLEFSQDVDLTRELESMPNEKLEMNSGDPESNSAGAAEHPKEYIDKKKDKVTKDTTEPEPYVCSICSVICDCPIVFESHLMGRRHAAGIKKHVEVLFVDKKILEESLKENDHPRDALEELRIQPKETQESINEVCQITKERVENESEALLIAEAERNLEFLKSKEAREQLEGSELLLKNTLKQKSCEAENTSERAEEDVGEKKKNNRGSATQSRVCDWCNVMCTSQADFDSHLRGKKHAATVNRYVPVVKKHVVVLKNHLAVVEKQAGTKFVYVRKNGP